ncbi:sulfate adenylyltransferase [Sulfoacidibacillus thermotolerans]|uniref:Sulfate adenylyltransferase n=1 Tax=Sulfoacidibacillus thermotolerans TaxID=1765684 RepID=A0A2U3DA48_SULT2|nr:sulfate adenylyltransferase [Sulfoacidibacillus thermotolerans]
MSSNVTPHGGHLVDRFVTDSQASFPTSHIERVILDDIGESDLVQIATGAFSPLTGFMGEEDYRSVVLNMRLANGIIWPLPVTLPISREQAKRIAVGDAVLLVDRESIPRAWMEVTSIFQTDLQSDVYAIYLTQDTGHPGVRRTFERGPIFLGGPIHVFSTANPPHDFTQYIHTPKAARDFFQHRGWKTVVGFQTRNPIHRAHEYLQKCALEISDGLFIHPLVGPTKADDIPADLRMRAYEIVISHYYPINRVALGVFTAAMRYAGPREAILHALVRKNYGCTHFIVGRDHAGVGSYYGTYDAQKIFAKFSADEIGITPLFFDHAFYCKACGGMATEKTCPHDEHTRLFLSGTKVRAMLQAGVEPPVEFTRPETARILMEYYTRGNFSKAAEK